MSIVYGIWADDARLPYYGSTTKTLAYRKRKHKYEYESWKKEVVSTYCSSFDLFDAVGVDACQFEIVERLLDDISKDDLRWRERWYIENCPCINKNIPIRTDKENAEYHRQYHEEHKEEQNEKRRKYHEAHKEQHKEYMRQYHARKKAERIEVFKALLKTDA